MIYIAFVIFTLIVLYIAFYQWQYFMVFSPLYYRDGELDRNSFEILRITTEDNITLEGVVYEPKELQNTLLFFAGRSQDAVGLIQKLSKIFPNTRILTFNYRSYGKSSGEASEKNILKDTLQIGRIVKKNYGVFYVLGFSLGSNFAAYLAKNMKTSGVFLIGAFDSIASVAREKFVTRGNFPMIDLSKVFRYKFDTKSYVQEIDEELYLFVSKDDEVTYIHNARVLKKHVKNLKLYKEYPNLKHHELLWDKEIVKLIKEVVEKVPKSY